MYVCLYVCMHVCIRTHTYRVWAAVWCPRMKSQVIWAVQDFDVGGF